MAPRLPPNHPAAVDRAVCMSRCTAPLPAGKVTARPERQQLILEFGEALPRQGALLWLSFRYSLRPGMAGFYRSVRRCCRQDAGSFGSAIGWGAQDGVSSGRACAGL